MKEKPAKANFTGKTASDKTKDELQGYTIYPESEDIYKKFQEEKDIDPEDTSALKETAKKDKSGSGNEKDFMDDFSGSDLDIPGSELDDNAEDIGNEDEENNYYSLGGDNHNDLDENKVE